MIDQKFSSYRGSSIMSSPALSFATPWVPSLRGNNLPPCALVSDLIEYGTGPTFRKSGDRWWTEAGCENELLAALPESREAIMESVVMIWRFAGEGGEGEG